MSKAQEQASVETIQSARRTLIPDINASVQANYSIYNNLTGMFYPEYILPVSGPLSTENLNDMVDSTFFKVFPQLLGVTEMIHPREQLAMAGWKSSQYMFKADKLRLPAQLHAFEKAGMNARVHGYVNEVRADIGDKVSKGSVLVKIEAPMVS